MKDSLGDRIKSYEGQSRTTLLRRSYAIMRLDGVSFSNYTKSLSRPFNKGLMEDMIATTKHLCENIMNVKLGYTQSDEITLVMTDFENYKTQAWFDNQIQKMVSVAAGIASAKFLQLRYLRALKENPEVDITKLKLPSFDARIFQVPTLNEVNNVLIWRQRDFVRNSVAVCGQAMYSHTQLKGLKSGQIQELIFQKSEELVEKLIVCGFDDKDMLLAKPNFNWNDLAPNLKRGTTFMLKNDYSVSEQVDQARKKRSWEQSAFEYSSNTVDDLGILDNSRL